MNKVLKTILDFIFPIQCISCKIPGNHLCDKCFSKIPLRDKKQCPICNKEQADNELCQSCQQQTCLDKIIICSDYENETLQKTIHAFKYSNVKDLDQILGKILINKYQQGNKLPEPIIIPTPLHRKRQLERGFNQCKLLAQVFANSFNLTVDNRIIFRQRNNAHQADLNKKQREKNIKGCFKIKNKAVIENKNIILIDDVITTGATLNEQAKLLKQAGAKQIWAIVLAKN